LFHLHGPFSLHIGLTLENLNGVVKSLHLLRARRPFLDATPSGLPSAVQIGCPADLCAASFAHAAYAV